MTPFNLEDALKGKAVVTRNKNKVKILGKTRDGMLLVTIFSHCGPSGDKIVKVNLDGSRYSVTSENFEDLMMAV